MDLDAAFRRFWGKAQPVPEAACRWHPLWMHALDVAAVGRALAVRHPAPFRAMADALDWTADDLVRLWTLALALHDLGKFARTFQAKAPDHWPAAVLGPLDETTLRQADPGHPATGIGLLRRPLRPLLEAALPGWRLPQLTALFLPVLAHHGQPVEPHEQTVLTFGPAAEGAAEAFARAMLELLAPPPVAPPPISALRRVGWRLAGLSVLADWIGSNQRWFPYAADADRPVASYWTGVALPRAEVAVRAAGVLPAPTAPYAGLPALLGRPGLVASPLQTWAEEVDLPDGPLLFLLEDMTGSGKTEAALAIAHRLMADRRAHGLYLALPTMATANAMYRRLAAAYRRMFAPGADPSLVLAHGRAALDEGFRQSIVEPAPGQRPAAGCDAADGDCAAECAAWLAHDRRKAFLSDVGVGTIDQALLAVLPARHQAIRLAALADRVLVIDEAHAYDAYMGAEIDRLLAAHAMQGGHAIVLSATLPRPTKQRIALEWSAAVRAPAPPGLGSAYPGATRLAIARPVLEQPIRPRPDLPRRLGIARLADADAAVTAIAAAARAGAAVAWVRNTVDDAIAAVDRLAAHGVAADLFHARFAMGHRLAIEDAVLGRFGRDGTPEGRRGRVLVATQVVEQSLDLDFDLMVSDLAPIDLLLQRAGRVWRHLDRRPAAGRPVPGPRLLVLAPDPDGTVGPGWVRSFLPGTGAVYKDHGILWLTARHAFPANGIVVPDDLPGLIERVYGEDAGQAVPAGLERIHQAAHGDRLADRSHAMHNLLDLDAGYVRDGQPWPDDTRVATRLADDGPTLRLARWDGATLAPLCPDPEPRRAWAMSEVSVRAGRVGGEAPATGPLAAAIAAAKTTWGRYEQDTLLVPLREDAGGLRGDAVDGEHRPVAIRYGAGRGVEFGSGPSAADYGSPNCSA